MARQKPRTGPAPAKAQAQAQQSVPSANASPSPAVTTTANSTSAATTTATKTTKTKTKAKKPPQVRRHVTPPSDLEEELERAAAERGRSPSDDEETSEEEHSLDTGQRHGVPAGGGGGGGASGGGGGGGGGPHGLGHGQHGLHTATVQLPGTALGFNLRKIRPLPRRVRRRVAGEDDGHAPPRLNGQTAYLTHPPLAGGDAAALGVNGTMDGHTGPAMSMPMPGTEGMTMAGMAGLVGLPLLLPTNADEALQFISRMSFPLILSLSEFSFRSFMLPPLPISGQLRYICAVVVSVRLLMCVSFF
jgi:hypothetical protein